MLKESIFSQFIRLCEFEREVEANKRRAKERVRERKRAVRGKKWLAIKYKLLEWLS